MAAVPAGASLVASVNVAALRQTAIGSELAADNREVPGIGRIGDVCGFDPTAQIQEFVLAIPKTSSGARDFGIALGGDFSAERIASCATRILEKRGAHAVRTRIGSFSTLRAGDRPGGEIAVRDSGPVILGGYGYVREMINAVDGVVPSIEKDELHRALRNSLGNEGTLLATWVTPANWLEEMLAPEAPSVSSLSGIRLIALRIDALRGVEARAIVVCVKDACSDVLALFQALKKQASSSPLVQGLALERLRMQAGKNRIELSFALDANQVMALAARWLERVPELPMLRPTPASDASTP